MSLYDDLDSKPPGEQIDGWSSGIKLLQQQLVAKKTSAAASKVCDVTAPCDLLL